MGAHEAGIGDYECDGDVDMFDFLGWSGCYTGPQSEMPDAACASFDYNSDGSIDWTDFARLQRAWPMP